MNEVQMRGGACDGRRRLVLHEDAETLRARGAAVTGPAEAVDRIVDGLTVLNARTLGPTRSAMVYGDLDDDRRRRARRRHRDRAGRPARPLRSPDRAERRRVMKTLWTERTWVFPRRMLSEILGLTLLAWGSFVAVVAATTTGIATFGTVDQSIWDFAVEFVPWYAVFIGGYVAHDLLPRYITHGVVRRDFAIQGTIFVVLFAAALSVLITLGFLLERVLYRIADWPQELSQDHLFTSSTEAPLILVEYWLVFLVWTSAGALVGGAWYRSDWQFLARPGDDLADCP